MKKNVLMILCLLTIGCTASAQIGPIVVLEWESTGDDGMLGQATCLELAMTTDTTLPIEQWPRIICDSLPRPLLPGQTQSLTIYNLAYDTDYFFHMRISDEVPNWSGWSNLCIKHTDPLPPDTTPPGAPINLRAKP